MNQLQNLPGRIIITRKENYYLVHQYQETPTIDEFELNPYEYKDCKKVIHSRDSHAECDFCENCYCFKCSKVESKEAYKRLWSDKDEDGIMIVVLQVSLELRRWSSV